MKQNSRIFLLFYIAAISALGPLLTDFYLPALPSMTTAFEASTTQIQLTITYFLIGLAFGQLIMGPLSDKFGRKPILLYSFILFILATIGCLCVNDIYLFVFFRLLQGIAGSGGVVVSRSIVADLFKGEDLAKFFALLGAIHGLAPICAPLLGGAMLKISDWKGIFMLLLFIGIMLLAVSVFFRESLHPKYRKKGSMWEDIAYFHILKNRPFMFCVFTQSFAAGVIFSFISSSSFIFQEYFQLSQFTFSLLFAGVAIGTMLGSILSTLFKSKRKALTFGVMWLAAMSVVIFVLLNLKVHFLILEAGFFAVMFALGFIMPSSTALAMELERKNAGSASAVLGFGAFFIGGMVSPLTGLGSDIFVSTSLVIVFCSVCAVIGGIKAIRANS